MNKTRFALSVLIGFAFVFAYEFVVHGIWLKSTYELTPHLWRTELAMQDFVPLIFAIQFLFTAVLCFIYTRHHEGKGISEGIRFGAMFGLLLGVTQFGMYAYMPISLELATIWLGSTILEVIGLGMIFSLIYKK